MRALGFKRIIVHALTRSLRIAAGALLCLQMTGCFATLSATNRAQGEHTFKSPFGKEQRELKPAPAFYALYPVTIPFDIATFPIQFPIFMKAWHDD